MKRRREAEAEALASEMRSAIEELSLMADHLKGGGADEEDGDHHSAVAAAHRVPIKPFLSLCSLLIHVLDKIGPTMAVFRQDIHQNIQRLEKFYGSDPTRYWDVVEIIKKEIHEGKAKQGPTCSKSFVWLTRTLEFTSALLELLVKDFERNMEQAVEESYSMTLKPWHGWISSTAYKVALKLVPESRTLLSILRAKDMDGWDMLKAEMQRMISLLAPILEQNRDILRTYDLDKLKST